MIQMNNAEYSAVREAGAGLIDLSARGRLLVSGSEAIPFLNGLITNDMKTLEANTWMPAAFPNVQGRLIAAVRVIRLAERDGEKSPTFLIDTESASHERVFKAIERFTLAGDFHVKDITAETSQLSLQGPGAAGITSKGIGSEAANLSSRGASRVMFGDSEITIIRSNHTGADGFDFILETGAARNLRDRLTNAGATPVGEETLEVLRIEAGIPRYGIDMDDTNVVTETSLDDAVSYTKGCYVGQEIIARIKYRGHVAKQLTGLSFAGKVDVEPGTVIDSIDGKEIGRVTSATFSPQLGYSIALGYLKYDYLAAGTTVKLSHGGNEIEATVTASPFITPTQSEELEKVCKP